jgi:arylsulfatase A-like enzyme
MSEKINRREFLKMASLLPLMISPLPSLLSNTKPEENQTNHPNILFILFDTFSAQHMSLYGYDRETTPNIARFAERATVFHSHYAGGNFTSPGTASLLTGTYPWTHRAFHMHGTVIEKYAHRNMLSLLPSNITKVTLTHTLLAQSLLQQFKEDIDVFKYPRELALVDTQYSDILFSKDYNVSYWAENVILRSGARNPSSLFVGLAYRLFKLVEKRKLVSEYGSLFPKGIPNLNDIYYLLESAVDWMIQNLSQIPEPYFGYFHLLPPHEPYTPRREFVDRFSGDNFKPIEKAAHFTSSGTDNKALNRERRDYDSHILYTDAEFGRLLDYLIESGVMEKSYVILTSDHGELFERGIRGHITPVLYEPLIRIPLLISKPGQTEKEDVHDNTSCIDLLPTILALMSEPIPEWSEGQVLPTFPGYAGNSQSSIYVVEAKGNPIQAPVGKGTFALIKDRYKLVHYQEYNLEEGRDELYDLSKDPDEMSNLFKTKRATADELMNELKEKIRSANAPFLPS